MPVPTITIKTSDGEALTSEMHVLYLETSRQANVISKAEVCLREKVKQSDGLISDVNLFNPGEEMEILIRWGDDPDVTIFKGLIIRHNFKMSNEGACITLELRNKAHALTYPRKSVVHEETTDKAIIEKIIGESVLEMGTYHAAGQGEYEHTNGIVQYYCSDWDFLLSRADANGLLVFNEDDAISISPYTSPTGVIHIINFDAETVESAEMEIDGEHQYTTINGIAWDIGRKAPAAVQTAEEFVLEQGTEADIDGSTIAGLFGISDCNLVSAVPMAPEETAAWANARMMKSRMSLIRGTITITGNTQMALGDAVTIEKTGTRFNGTAMITGIHHEAGIKGWSTTLQLGLCGEWFTKEKEKNITDTPAAGLLPAINGLQIGVVVDLDDSKDPLGQNRIHVNIPSIGEGSENAIWARFASPYANEGTGILFRPEEGDEVVVGFLNDDPRQAIIVGALYSSVNAMPAAPGKDNFMKSIMTKGGITIEFNDENTELKMKTSDDTSIAINDTDKTIVIADNTNENTITLNDSGVTVSAKAGMTFTTDGDMVFTAGGNITLDGAGVETI